MLPSVASSCCQQDLTAAPHEPSSHRSCRFITAPIIGAIPQGVDHHGKFDLASVKDPAKPAESAGAASETAVGDFAGAFASAPVKLDATYSTRNYPITLDKLLTGRHPL